MGKICQFEQKFWLFGVKRFTLVDNLWYNVSEHAKNQDVKIRN